MHKCAPFSSGVLCSYSLMDYDMVYFGRMFHIPVCQSREDVIKRLKEGVITSRSSQIVSKSSAIAHFCAASGRVRR